MADLLGQFTLLAENSGTILPALYLFKLQVDTVYFSLSLSLLSVMHFQINLLGVQLSSGNLICTIESLCGALA